MRTNRRYSIWESTAILTQYFISRISLWYFRKISSKRITLIRKQGIGDAVFSSGVVEEFVRQHPETSIKLVVSFPELFNKESQKSFSWKDFPLVWLMYEHYDFAPLKREDKHIKYIIAEHLGLRPDMTYDYEIALQENQHKSFRASYIDRIDYMVLQPWAGEWNRLRNWSKDKWEETIAKLETELPIYQIGSKNDPLIDGAFDLRGKTSVLEGIFLIKNAKIFIGVNSFGEQVAGAYKVPSVVLYGPTNPMYSLNENQIAVFKDVRKAREELSQSYEFSSLDNVDVDHVISSIEEVMSFKSTTE